MRLQTLTEFDYHHTLAQALGTSLVLFSSPACGTCRLVEQRLPQATGTLIDHLYKVDVQQATALARQYDLFHLPVLFLYRNGQFHAQLDSEVTPEKLQHTIQQALRHPAQDEP